MDSLITANAVKVLDISGQILTGKSTPSKRGHNWSTTAKKKENLLRIYGKHKTLERSFVFYQALVVSLLFDNFGTTRLGPVEHSLNVIAYSNTQSATKLVETLRPKLYCPPEGKIKLFLSHPLHAMLCPCSGYPQKTTNTPALNEEEREGKVQV